MGNVHNFVSKRASLVDLNSIGIQAPGLSIPRAIVIDQHYKALHIHTATSRGEMQCNTIRNLTLASRCDMQWALV